MSTGFLIGYAPRGSFPPRMAGINGSWRLSTRWSVTPNVACLQRKLKNWVWNFASCYSAGVNLSTESCSSLNNGRCTSSIFVTARGMRCAQTTYDMQLAADCFAIQVSQGTGGTGIKRRPSCGRAVLITGLSGGPQPDK